MRTYAFAPCAGYESTMYSLPEDCMVSGTVDGYEVGLYTEMDAQDVRRDIAVELIPGKLWAIAVPRFQQKAAESAVGVTQ